MFGIQSLINSTNKLNNYLVYETFIKILCSKYLMNVYKIAVATMYCIQGFLYKIYMFCPVLLLLKINVHS